MLHGTTGLRSPNSPASSFVLHLQTLKENTVQKKESLCTQSVCMPGDAKYSRCRHQVHSSFGRGCEVQYMPFLERNWQMVKPGLNAGKNRFQSETKTERAHEEGPEAELLLCSETYFSPHHEQIQPFPPFYEWHALHPTAPAKRTVHSCQYIYQTCTLAGHTVFSPLCIFFLRFENNHQVFTMLRRKNRWPWQQRYRMKFACLEKEKYAGGV